MIQASDCCVPHSFNVLISCVCRTLALVLRKLGQSRIGGGGKPLQQLSSDVDSGRENIALLHLKGEEGLPFDGRNRTDRIDRLDDLDVVSIHLDGFPLWEKTRVTDEHSDLFEIRDQEVLRRVPILVNTRKRVILRSMNIRENNGVAEHVIILCVYWRS